MVSAENEPRGAGTIWMVDLDEPMPAITPLVAAVFRRAGPESAPALAAAMGGAAAEVQERFETGRSCYTAWVDSQLAAYGWVSFDEEMIGELNLRLRLLPGEAYIWDCATLPAFRQKRLFSALLVYLVNELRAGPLCRAWIGADLDNVASQRGIARAGFHGVADLMIAPVQGPRQVWVQSWPGVPESLVAEARRVFLGHLDGVWQAASPAKPSSAGQSE
jgi:ribosomal protein S18 acetylase RimI-like enzyme